MIRINCFFQAGTTTDYRTALAAAIELTEVSRRQDGNVAYDTFQSATHSDVFMICETWKDKDALEAHSASEEFKKNVGIIRSCGLLKIETFEF